MKIRPLLFLSLASGVFVTNGSAQEIDWSSIRTSVTAQWVIPQKGFGDFWNEGPSVGLLSELPSGGALSVVAAGIFSWHSPSDTPKKSSIPQVLLFQLGLGAKVGSEVSRTVEASFSAMLVNNAFILFGPSVRPGFDNEIESEFGFSLSTSLTYRNENLPPISLLASYQPILVGLEPVSIVSFGIAVGLGAP